MIWGVGGRYSVQVIKHAMLRCIRCTWSVVGDKNDTAT